jgi:signal transduction histidine kinase
MVRTDPEAAERVLAKLAENFSAEQRELRLYVDELSLEEPLWADRRIPLGERLADMLDRIQAIWGVGTSLDGNVGDTFDAELERRILRIIQEAVVNAARHGGANHVRVRVESGPEAILIELSDDGHGFPFLGNYDDQELKDQRLGPVSLKHRVGQGGGTIAIQSTQEGAMLQISLPTPRRSP